MMKKKGFKDPKLMASTALGLKQVLDMSEKTREETSGIIGNLGASTMMLGATAGIMGFLLGRLKNMFGNENGMILKDVVREMMEGAVSGISNHFEHKIEDLKRALETANKKVETMEQEQEINENLLQERFEEIEKLKERLAKAQKPAPKKKR